MPWDFSDDERDRTGRLLAERGLTGPVVSTHRIGEGHSNLTFTVDDGERRVVLRRGPPPPTPPGAHDMLRESRMLDALADTPVPVPAVLATFDAGELLDVPAYVMEHVEGSVVTTRTPGALATPAERARLGIALVDVLARLHAVDWRTIGGRPEGFNRRHLRAVARLVGDDPPPGFALLLDRLEAGVPEESGASVVHNDYRLGNVVVAPDTPGRVVAVLDWELATVGDPLFDLGYLLASVPQSEPRTATEALGTAMLEPGWPDRAALARRYAEATGRDVSGLPWFVALAQLKLAALFEYQRRRGDDPYYADPTLVADFVAAGLRTMDGEETP